MNDKKKDRSVQEILGSCDQIIAHAKKQEAFKGKNFETIHDVDEAFEDYLSETDPSEIEPATQENKDNRRVLFANDPRHSAEQFLSDCMMVQGVRSLHCVPETEQFYIWKQSHYQTLDNRRLQAIVARYLDFSWVETTDKETGEKVLIPYPSNPNREKAVMDCLKSLCCETVVADPQERPTWMALLADDRPNPEGIIPFKNWLLSIDDFLTKGSFDSLRKNTPQFMSIEQIPFDIDPNDHKRLLPVKWLYFLETIFGEDQHSIDCLQEWIGYCLSRGTWAHKFLMLIGPPRSGKSTIGRILSTMLGERNVVAPSAKSMAGQFGLKSWLGKRLAIFGDARFGDYSDRETIKETILQITGGDMIEVDRKNIDSISVRLPTKILFISNELPYLRDGGGALSTRLLILRTKCSFVGKEDFDLLERDLLPEIPRIFWWALEGLKRLLKTKKFTQSEEGKSSIKEMEEFQAPVKVFVLEMCKLGSNLEVKKEVIYSSYLTWCQKEGENHLDLPRFSQKLTAAFPEIKCTRLRRDGARENLFLGISLADRS